MDEFTLIESIRTRVGNQRTSPHGIGDDGAVLLAEDGRCVVLDAMVEGVHFRPEWSSWHDVAHKLLARNVSDVQAMGAEPTAFLLGLVLNNPAIVPELADGLVAAVDALCPGVTCVGGDTTRTPGPSSLTMTMFGRLDGPVRGRACARPGDSIFVQGPIGWAAAGLHALSAGVGDSGVAAPFVAAHRRPHPVPIRFANTVPRAACIDISDGLYADLMHIAQASGVRMHIDAPVPGVDALLEFARVAGGDPAAWQWHGGDDYTKVVCAPEQPCGEWFRVGTVLNESPGLTGLIPEASGGYRHFE
jgi:thiamine-monophosphate kinase